MSDRANLDDLFDECFELEGADRQRRIDEVAAGEPELAEQLRSLLDAHAAAPTFLDRPVSNWLPGALAEGSEVGGFRLLERLGEGGMGVVFLAERADLSFEHRVAIKFVRSGFVTERLVSRFAEEQRILAMLNHPNIARLYDAGVTDSGTPYLVMEFVEGVPLVEYCDSKRLRVPERLELFTTLCRAVEYAHRRLIVHQDLKPANILVTPDGTPKLLDFGIAKLIADSEDGEAVTQTAVRAMTPSYASPEQILGQQVTTATDVYGLGIILYELLCGHRPHAEPGLPRHELERRVCQEEPVAPSKRLVGAQAEEIAARRSVTPRRLRRRLQGELDSIARMALRRIAHERYESVSNLRQDLVRYGRNEPVSAERQTFAYTAARFVRRRRGPVAATLLLSSVLVWAFVSVAADRTRAEAEAKKASEIAGFLERLFEYANPELSGGETPTILEMLDEGARRIEQGLAEQPKTRAELQLVMARAYIAAGFYDKAEPLAERSVETLRQVDGAEPELGRSLHGLALVRWDQGEFSEALVAGEESLEIRRRHASRSPLAAAQSTGVVAMILGELGETERAERLFREAISSYDTHGAPRDQELARIKNNFGTMLSVAGQYEEAEVLLRESLEIQEAVLGTNHPDVARATNNLAILLRRRGKMDEAESMYREALAIRREIHPNGHPDVAQSLNNLGAFHYAERDYARAEELFEQALAMWSEFLPSDHAELARVRTNLSAMARRAGNHDRAFDLLTQVLPTHRKTLGDRHRVTLDAIFRLGEVEIERARFREALELLREAFEGQVASIDPRDRAVARTLLATGTAELALGRTIEAEQHLNEACSIFEEIEDPLLEQCSAKRDEIESRRAGGEPRSPSE